jgi:hypothetical protein
VAVTLVAAKMAAPWVNVNGQFLALKSSAIGHAVSANLDADPLSA